jgi:hypothetical protein
MAAALSGCAAIRDAPRLAYQCPEGLRFEARLYEDMATLDGQRGHAVLERLPHQRDDELIYGDATLTADFGLGLEQRLARLSYANIPEAVTCTRVVPAGQPAVPVRAAPARARATRRRSTPTRRCRPTSAPATATWGRVRSLFTP